MKSVICLTILAFVIACASACNPDGNNQPECTARNVNMPVRNFWDPTGYWMCNADGATADTVKCPIAQGFDSVKGVCVPWSEWSWTAPCPDSL